MGSTLRRFGELCPASSPCSFGGAYSGVSLKRTRFFGLLLIVSVAGELIVQHCRAVFVGRAIPGDRLAVWSDRTAFQGLLPQWGHHRSDRSASRAVACCLATLLAVSPTKATHLRFPAVA